MMFPRIKVLLTHLAAAILGAFTFAVLFFWMRSHISRDHAAMTCYVARQSYSAGKDDQAIFLLGQASAEDRSYYEPLNLLASIYWHKGNQELALETYKKALEIFDKEGDPLLPPRANVLARDLICKNIDALQKRIGKQPSN
jgi:tetratricopeptide (TPR) repeat protein